MTGPAPARYVLARTVAEAVAAMADGARPVAGGTDLVVGARQGKSPLPEFLVGIHRLPGLGTVEPPDSPDGCLRIGALVTHEVLATHPEVSGRFTGVSDAAAIVGSHATRAHGTLGGNVMNGSPAMDTGAPLLCHGAVAVLHGPRGVRRVGLDELWTAPGRVSSSPDELLVAVELPPPAPEGPTARAGSAYVRLQYRRQMEIAVVGAAALVTVVDGVVVRARIAISALAPTIRRVPAAEESLLGATVGDGTAGNGSTGNGTPGGSEGFGERARAAGALAAEAALPITDVRGSAAYRRAMAAVVTRRAVTAAATRATGGRIAVPASDSTWGC